MTKLRVLFVKVVILSVHVLKYLYICYWEEKKMRTLKRPKNITVGNGQKQSGHNQLEILNHCQLLSSGRNNF